MLRVVGFAVAAEGRRPVATAWVEGADWKRQASVAGPHRVFPSESHVLGLPHRPQSLGRPGWRWPSLLTW